MGASGSANRKPSFDVNGEVNFDHFVILRAIGRGSFGKVCIVQKRDTEKLYAMKYMNKSTCVEKNAVNNVLSEVNLLKKLDHPFIVNVWFTFQDEEDMCIVVDLLLGGDLRYHMSSQQNVIFNERHLKLYICEIGLALDYLRRQNVIHRDIKPDNILLDEEGHIHITDFNVAIQLEPNELVTSLAGTKPYMAPEIFSCALNECQGYSFPIDWWSLGVCAYEILRGKRPYDIHTGTTPHETRQMIITTNPHFSSSWEEGLKDLVKQLLSLDPNTRISSLQDLSNHSYLTGTDFEQILRKQIKPDFIPQKDHLNCDPSYELEEMIIEAKPLHKKKKRLAKHNINSRLKQNPTNDKDADPAQLNVECIFNEFKSYNRQRINSTI